MSTFIGTYGHVKYTRGISRATPVSAGQKCELDDCENSKILIDLELQPPWWNLTSMHRDHCHKHGWIRAFTCPACNAALAFTEQFKDMPEAKQAIAYAIRNGYKPLVIPVTYRNLCPDCR